MRYSLIDTASDTDALAVLHTDWSNTDPFSEQNSRANIAKAGGHVLRAKSEGTLTTNVTNHQMLSLMCNRSIFQMD